MPSPAVVVVGSLNADFVVGVPRFPVPGETLAGRSFDVLPGGKGGNQACAAARLGAGVAMVGQVGADAHGSWLRHSLAGAGVDVALVATDATASSGIALITRADSGQNEIVILAGANGTFKADRLSPALGAIRAARVVLLQLEIPIATVLRAAAEAREAGAAVLLDPAPARPVPDELLALADYVTPNETELLALTGQETVADEDAPLDTIEAAAGRLLARGARRVLVKLGSRGAMLVASDGTMRVPPRRVSAVDTTAAGDAFNGAFAVALAEDQPVADGLRFAAAAAALSVTRAGAQPSMPTRNELTTFLTPDPNP